MSNIDVLTQLPPILALMPREYIDGMARQMARVESLRLSVGEVLFLLLLLLLKHTQTFVDAEVRSGEIDGVAHNERHVTMNPLQTLKGSARKLVHKSPGIKKLSGKEDNGRKLGHKKSRSLFSGSFDYGELCEFYADLSILIV